MRHLFLLLAGAVPLCAQFVVTDPTNTAVNTAIRANQMAQHGETMRQWAEQIERLNRQLRNLEDQLITQQRIRDVMGDPTHAGLQMILREVGGEEMARSYGETLQSIRRLSNAVDSLKRTSDGIYRRLDDLTSLKAGFNRQVEYYRRFAVVETQAADFEKVQKEADERSAALQREIAATLQEIKQASTQAEVDKHTAKLAALNAQLAEAAARRSEAAQRLNAAQVLNENQAAKERQDLLERQIAEERQTLDAVGNWQKSIRLTPTNYEKR
jgi:hypothetical protein